MPMAIGDLKRSDIMEIWDLLEKDIRNYGLG